MTTVDMTPTDIARALGEGWCRFVRGAVRGEAIPLPAGSIGIGGEDFAEMNWGMVHGPDGVADTVRRFGERLRARKLPGVIGDSAAVASAAAPVAEELGLVAEPLWPMMTCSAETYRPAVPGGGAPVLRASRVSYETAIAAACEVMGAGFGPAAWRCVSMLGLRFVEQADADLFLATPEDVPAAVAGTGRVGALVGIYAVATTPDLRRRGAASTAVCAAVEHHLARGARRFGLRASEAGARVYARLGFSTVESTPVWYVGDPA